MIKTAFRKIGGLPLQQCWFAARPQTLRGQNLVYRQCQSSEDVRGFVRTPFYTKIIDLTHETAAIVAAFDKSTAYDIRRAEKDGVTFELETDVPAAGRFYDEFAVSKNMQQVGGKLGNYFPYLQVTKAVYGGEALVMHYFLQDAGGGRARMLHSASQFRSADDPAARQRVGRANRYLHLQDMAFFKQAGFREFDLGGYAWGEVTPERQRINDFKDGFGGQLVQESDYVPGWLHWGERLKSRISNTANR